MKTLLVICFLVIKSFIAAPLLDESKAYIVLSDDENDGNGNYTFSFETSNGIVRSETGSLINEGQPDEHIKVDGFYSYTDPDGKIINIRYTADENGFRIVDIIPQVVFQAPLPAAVVATLLGG